MELVLHAEVGDRRLAALTFDDGPSPSTLSIPRRARRPRCAVDLLRHGPGRRGERGGTPPGGARGTRAGRPRVVPSAPDGHRRRPGSGGARAHAEARPDGRRGRATLLRPPYGRAALRYARLGVELGLAPTVLWSVDGYDYQDGVQAGDMSSSSARACGR